MVGEFAATSGRLNIAKDFAFWRVVMKLWWSCDGSIGGFSRIIVGSMRVALFSGTAFCGWGPWFLRWPSAPTFPPLLLGRPTLHRCGVWRINYRQWTCWTCLQRFARTGDVACDNRSFIPIYEHAGKPVRSIFFFTRNGGHCEPFVSVGMYFCTTGPTHF